MRTYQLKLENWTAAAFWSIGRSHVMSIAFHVNKLIDITNNSIRLKISVLHLDVMWRTHIGDVTHLKGGCDSSI